MGSVGKATVQIGFASIGLLFSSRSSILIMMKLICFALLVGIGVVTAFKCKIGLDNAAVEVDCKSGTSCAEMEVSVLSKKQKFYAGCIPSDKCGTEVKVQTFTAKATCSSSVIQRMSFFAFLPIVATILLNLQ